MLFRLLLLLFLNEYESVHMREVFLSPASHLDLLVCVEADLGG